MAARPAAAQQNLPAMVGREPRAIAPRATRAARGRLRRPSCDTERRGPRGRTGDANSGKTVYRLFARLPRRALCHEPVAAGPLPDAGQPRGLGGFDLCPAASAARRESPGGFAVVDDGPPLRGL